MTQNKSQEPVSDDIASILACRDMLDAQPVPTRRTEQNFCSRCGKRTADLTTIHTCTPPVAQQESVADDFFRMIADRNPKPFPLPQRTWVGLTEQQRKEIERQSVYVDGAIRMTEAKLKENNT